jgi:hypothetical protein
MITLTNGYPQGPNGLIVPNGSISFQLNTDAIVVAAPGGFVSSDIVVTFQFDASGKILPNAPSTKAQIYSNAELYPQQSSTLLGTYYLVTFYDQNGARLNQVPMWWQFPEAAGATVDISQIAPFMQIGGNVIFYPTNFGGVSSVSFTGDGVIFSSAAGTPVTSIGTLTPSLLPQAPHVVLAGPGTGVSNANPTFRALVAADIPTLPANLLTPAGSTKQVQVNLTNALYADSGFTYDPSTHAGAISGAVTFGSALTVNAGVATLTIDAPGNTSAPYSPPESAITVNLGHTGFSNLLVINAPSGPAAAIQAFYSTDTSVRMVIASGESVFTQNPNSFLFFTTQASGVVDFYRSGGSAGHFTCDLDSCYLAIDALTVRVSASPKSNDAGVTGTIVWDANYIYVCTSTGAWARAPLTGSY